MAEKQYQQEQLKSSQDTSVNINPITQTASAKKTNIHEMRNQDFISRLMAATPPYLYSAPVGPNNFFFSDMLRSLVQARNNENARNLQLQQSVLAVRRPRKRLWSQHRHYYEQLRERKECEKKPQHSLHAHVGSVINIEKPLELTQKSTFLVNSNRYSKSTDSNTKEADIKTTLAAVQSSKTEEYMQTETGTKTKDCENIGGAIDSAVTDTPQIASLPPQELVLPPPPPVWYPPLYPPYGIDPLHFFIDLRVSGHIYDRKKDNLSPLSQSDNTNINLSNDVESTTTSYNKRHGSAFTVPVKASHDAINLTNTNSANKFGSYSKYYDLGESKENHPIVKHTNANYMLQQLPRLYNQFAAHDLTVSNPGVEKSGANSNLSIDVDNKSEDSDGGDSTDLCAEEESTNRERDIDVEIVDSIKYRSGDDESSRCTSPDETHPSSNE